MAFGHNLTSKNLTKLLAAFSDNRATAGVAYTKLRDSLVRFFRLKGDFDPDDAADETLDRVASKISQNIPIPDLTKFSFGIARFVFLERIKNNGKEQIAAQGFYGDKLLSMPEVEKNDDFSPLRECFNRLTDNEKQVLQDYFADLPHPNLLEHRKKIQMKYNISLSGLRVKIFRLRERLENCLKEKSAK